MGDAASFRATRERFAERSARVAAVYGLSPLLGRLYGLLVLAPDPMTLDELAAAAGAAKSTVSVAMRQLERYRMVRRDWRKGDRRDFYQARTDYLDILRDWSRLMFQQELEFMTVGSAEARRSLAAAPAGGDWPDPAGREALLERLERMERMATLFRAWLDSVLGPAGPAEPEPAEVIPIEVE